jgi:hypothetical protein
LKKSIVVGIFCVLILVSIPIVSGKQHLYPKEEGPYTIFISGTPGSIGHEENLPKVLPFIDLEYPEKIVISFFMLPMFIVNGKLQPVDFPAQIRLYGFKGFCTPFPLIMLKHFLFGRIRIFGIADEMIAWEV